MMRRQPAVLAVVAALIVLAGRSGSTQAAAVTASYQLKNTAAPGSDPVTGVVANILPPGAVVPPSPQESPLTILAGSTGFDQDNLQVLLGDGQTPTGEPLQALALDFGDQGLAPGGILNFALSLASATQATPDLVLPPTASQLTLASYTPPSKPLPNPIPVVSVPEPVSVALWTAAAGLALVVGRLRSRARLAPAA